MEDAEDRRGIHQFRSDAGESRRWEDQTLEESSVQSCIRTTAARYKTGAEARPRHATSGRVCGGGGGPPQSTPDRETS